MHSLICGLITATMVLFPWKDGGGSVRAWMERYEAFLYQQMYDNFEREERERNADICQNPSESEVSFEQTASEETGAIQQHEEVHEVPVEETAPTEAVVETAPEITQPMVEVQPCNTVPIYSVNGAVLDIGVQEYLYQRLCEANIGWFYHYAILIAYQESRFDFYAVNQKNHLDMGLFQYRSTFWNYGDIFNPYDQINVFTVQMMQRANVGCSVAEMISRHKTSDWGIYDQEYVNQVMQWKSVLVQIR